MTTFPETVISYHVQINARSDADVDPQHILKRVADSSGAKYSVHNEKPTKRELPAPVVRICMSLAPLFAHQRLDLVGHELSTHRTSRYCCHDVETKTDRTSTGRNILHAHEK